MVEVRGDLGSLGADSATLSYAWSPFLTLSFAAPWLLGALLLLRRSNRRREAVTVFGIALGIRLVLSLLEGGAFPATPVSFLGTYALSIAVVLLCSDWILRGSARRQALWVVITIMAVNVLAASVGGLGTIFPLGFAWTVGLVLVGGWMLARRFGRRSASGARFALRLAPAMMLVSLVGAGGVFGVLLLFAAPVPLAQVFTWSFIVSGVGGGVFYLLTLPFLLFAMQSPLYRERLGELLPPKAEEPAAGELKADE